MQPTLLNIIYARYDNHPVLELGRGLDIREITQQFQEFKLGCSEKWDIWIERFPRYHPAKRKVTSVVREASKSIRLKSEEGRPKDWIDPHFVHP